MAFADLPERNWFTSEDVASEQAVLGSMLVDTSNTATALAVASLTEDDFTMDYDRALFAAFKTKFLASEITDPVTVLDAVAPGDKRMLGYLRELMEITPTAANVTEYIRLTREKSLRRQLRGIAEDLYRINAPQDAIPLLSGGLDLLSQDSAENEADTTKLMQNFFRDLKHKPQYLPWGFPFLDKTLFVERGDFVVLGGRPSDGKTALALHMAYSQAATLNVGFFSLETNLPKLAVRLMSSKSGVPLEHIKARSLRQDESMLLSGAAEEIAKRRLTFIEASKWTVDQIAARTLARRFDVIYVDYLQIVESSVHRIDRTPEVADISRALANLARRHKVAVVALSQLSRPAQKTKRTSPVLADLRESGQIEQDADVALFIWRQTEASSKSKRYLTLAKNKEGQMGDWELVFRGETQKFVPELSGCSVPASAKPPEQIQFTELSGEDPDMPF